MEKITKIALIAIGAGALLCLLSYFLIGGDWTGYNSKGNEHVAKTYESGTDIKEIKIDETSNEVNIVVADTDIVTIEYFDDPEKPIYEIEEKNGKLDLANKYNADARNLKEKISTIEIRIRTIEESIDNLQDEIDEQEADLHSKEKQIAEAEKNISDFNDNINACGIQINQNNKKTQDNKALAAELDEAGKEHCYNA